MSRSFAFKKQIFLSLFYFIVNAYKSSFLCPSESVKLSKPILFRSFGGIECALWLDAPLFRLLHFCITAPQKMQLFASCLAKFAFWLPFDRFLTTS